MAAVPDPYESYLKRAEGLFAAGDIVQAGQIWQAILKKKPDHETARAGLYKVKLHFDARATQDGLAAAKPSAPASGPAPAGDARATADHLAKAQDPEIVRLLEQGCTLYDAGHVEEAAGKWMQVLAKDPENALAKGYINGTRRTVVPSAAPALAVSSAAAPAAAPVAEASQEPDVDVDRLLRDGCTLFDMGQVEDALKKWEQILAHDPGHSLARAYAQDARRDLGLPLLEEGARPVVSRSEPMPAANVPAGAGPEDERLEKLIRDGVQLYDMGMVHEATEKWREVLAQAPGHRDAEAYLAMAERDQEAPVPAPKPVAASPGRPPARVPEHGPATPASSAPLELVFQESAAPPPPAETASPAAPAQPVAPPSALTSGLQKARQGFNLPEVLQRISLPSWMASPVFILGTITGLVVLVIGSFYYVQHRKDTALEQAVASFRASATAPVLRNAEVAKVQEPPAELRRQAESLVDADPLVAYFLAEELLRLDPGDAAAAQLLERARAGIQAEELEPATVADFERQIRNGELEAADRSLLFLLSRNPDDRILRERAGRLCSLLAQAYASKEQWTEAESRLRRGQAMFPSDRSWTAKRLLLSRIQSMARKDRTPWIQLLG